MKVGIPISCGTSHQSSYSAVMLEKHSFSWRTSFIAFVIERYIRSHIHKTNVIYIKEDDY